MARVANRHAQSHEPDAVSTPSLYEEALPPGTRALYRQAHGEHGLHGEIALLRLYLYQILCSHDPAGNGSNNDPAITAQVLRTIDLLVKALRVHGADDVTEQVALEQVLEEEARRLRATITKN